jgi:hypothetical protein
VVGDEMVGGDGLVVAKSRNWCGYWRTTIAFVAKPGESGWKLIGQKLQS